VALFSALYAFAFTPTGFTNGAWREHVAALFAPGPRGYTSTRRTYDLRRLRLDGLVHRVPHTLVPLNHRLGLTRSVMPAQAPRPRMVPPSAARAPWRTRSPRRRARPMAHQRRRRRSQHRRGGRRWARPRRRRRRVCDIGARAADGGASRGRGADGCTWLRENARTFTSHGRSKPRRAASR